MMLRKRALLVVVLLWLPAVADSPMESVGHRYAIAAVDGIIEGLQSGMNGTSCYTKDQIMYVLYRTRNESAKKWGLPTMPELGRPRTSSDGHGYRAVNSESLDHPLVSMLAMYDIGEGRVIKVFDVWFVVHPAVGK